MGYVPPQPAAVGTELKRETTDSSLKVWIEVQVYPDVYVWINNYSITNVPKSSMKQTTYLNKTLESKREMTGTEKQIIDDQLYNKREAEIKDMSAIGGINLYPPDGLTIKQLVKWYEQHILAVIKKTQELAVSLGKNPDEVGKVLVATTNMLAGAATSILTVAGASAGVIAAAGPIGAGIAVVISILDAFGVFKSGDDAQTKELGFQYNALSFIMKKWSTEYSIQLSKLAQIDDLEFKKYLTETYGSKVLKEEVKTPASILSSPTAWIKENQTTAAVIGFAIIFIFILWKRGTFSKA